MTFLNKHVCNILNIHFLLAIISSSPTPTTTSETPKKPLETEINNVISEFIDEDIRNNKTLLDEVKMAIEHVWPKEEHHQLDSRGENDTIDTRYFKPNINQTKIIKKLRTFLRALSIYKVGSLSDSIEQRLKTKVSNISNECESSDSNNYYITDAQTTVFSSKYEDLRTESEFWYSMLRNCRDDVDIRRLSDYLEELYYKNFTDLFGTERKSENIEQFKSKFCFALSEIRNQRDYLGELYSNDESMEVYLDIRIPLDINVEIFLKALGKWVDCEDPELQPRDESDDDDSILDSTEAGSLKKEINKVVNEFIGEDIRNDEMLLSEVKSAIKHVLSKKHSSQHHDSIKNATIREEIKEIKETQLNEYKTELRTFSKALWIYKTATLFKKPAYEEYDEDQPPLCTNCLAYGHPSDNRNSSKVIFGKNNSIPEEVYYWYFRLEYPEPNSNLKVLLHRLKEEYEWRIFPNKLHPKPETFRQFKFMCSNALAEIHHFANYLSTSYRNEPQMKECSLYGVPLYKHAMFLLKQFVFSQNLVVEYDDEK